MADIIKTRPSQVSAIGQQGFAPPRQSFTDFQWDEAVSVATKQQDVCEVRCELTLPRRKIYSYLWAGNSSTDYFAIANISFFNNLNLVGKLPLAVANSSALPSRIQSSIPSLISGGTANADSLVFYLANPIIDQPQAVTMQPFYAYGFINRATISIDNFSGVTSCRAILAIVSSQ